MGYTRRLQRCAVNRRSQRLIPKALPPQPRRKLRDPRHRVRVDSLQHINQVHSRLENPLRHSTLHSPERYPTSRYATFLLDNIPSRPGFSDRRRRKSVTLVDEAQRAKKRNEVWLRSSLTKSTCQPQKAGSPCSPLWGLLWGLCTN